MLSEFDIRLICKAAVATDDLFNCNVPSNAVVYAAMAKVNYEDRVYSEGDVKLIQFLYDNCELYPELFEE